MASKPTTEAITLHEVEEMSTVVVEQLAAVNRHVEAQEAELRQLKVMTKQLLLDNERRKVEVAAAEAELAATVAAGWCIAAWSLWRSPPPGPLPRADVRDPPYSM